MADTAWGRLSLAKKQLQLAISEEDYPTAAKLRDQIKDFESALPPNQRIIAGLIAKLDDRATEPREKITAAQRLGDLGSAQALPILQSSLSDPSIADIAESSMWSIFMTPPDDEVASRLFLEGLALLNKQATFNQALEKFTSAIEKDPSFAEGYNKRATVLYLMGKHREAIEDCRIVLELNPYHFGACSGMGMCAASIGDYELALTAFKKALEINPQLEHLRHHILELQALLQRSSEETS